MGRSRTDSQNDGSSYLEALIAGLLPLSRARGEPILPQVQARPLRIQPVGGAIDGARRILVARSVSREATSEDFQ
jgi:hypothetical protein